MGTNTAAGTFAEKFEEALEELRAREPGYGLRTLARKLAKDDPEKIETIRRRLNKYRPKPGGSTGEVAPTAPTRYEIEDAMGLERDALKPDPLQAAAEMISVLMPQAVFDSAFDSAIARRFAALQSNGPGTPTKSAPGPSTQEVLTHDGGNHA